MIANKNQLKKALKERKDSIKIKRIYNLDKDNKVKEGSTGYIEHVQSNAYTVKWDCYDKACWVRYDDLMIEIKDNKCNYYSFIGEKFQHNYLEELRRQNIELIELTDAEKEKLNKNTNAEYCYKYLVMQNEYVEA